MLEFVMMRTFLEMTWLQMEEESAGTESNRR